MLQKIFSPKVKTQMMIQFIDTAVSCDGSWQKRGYSSLNGVVTVSMDNGKLLDIEPMTRTCKSCLLHEKLQTSDPKCFKEWKLIYACKINHIQGLLVIWNQKELKEFARDLSGKTNYVTLSSMGTEIAKLFGSKRDI